MKRSPPLDGRDEHLADFDEFVSRVEARLRVALVATYGAHDGRAATVDALSWAWEHWTQIQTMDNPVGYLFRVGQSATRRYVVRPIPFERYEPTEDELLGMSVELVEAIKRLPVQQRTVVMLVHAFGWSQRDVAAVLEINASTVKAHLDRALNRLTNDLEIRDAR